MASAWGKSWGSAFGAAFGAVVISTQPIPEIGGGGTAYVEEDSIAIQIRQEDEILILAVAQMIVQGAFT